MSKLDSQVRTSIEPKKMCEMHFSLAEVGPKLPASVPNLGPSCALLDPSRAQVGAKWTMLTQVDPNWAHVAKMSLETLTLADLMTNEKWWNIRVFKESCTSAPKMPPPSPQLKLHHHADCIHSVLDTCWPRSGTFGAGRFIDHLGAGQILSESVIRWGSSSPEQSLSAWLTKAFTASERRMYNRTWMFFLIIFIMLHLQMMLHDRYDRYL